MIINLPEMAFDFEMREVFEKMPVIPNTNPKNKKHSSPVLHRIAYELKNNVKLYVVMTLFYKAIFRELRDRGIIVYDPETDTWKGVDYHVD